MSEKLRIAIVAGCLFVVGLHLRTAGDLLRAGWFGPYHVTDDERARPEQVVALGSSAASGSLAQDLSRDADRFDENGRGDHIRPGL
jgi:hypothetical protein